MDNNRITKLGTEDEYIRIYESESGTKMACINDSLKLFVDSEINEKEEDGLSKIVYDSCPGEKCIIEVNGEKLYFAHDKPNEDEVKKKAFDYLVKQLRNRLKVTGSES